MTATYIEWELEGAQRALWYSEAGLPPPKIVKVVDDTISANLAMADAKEGVGLLWNGDYHNARELLKALSRRLAKPPRVGSLKIPPTPAEIFHQHRLTQKFKAEVLGQLLIPLSKDFEILLRRGQDVQIACREVLGEISEPVVMPLKTLLAINSAHEWRKKKIHISSFEKPFTPHFGVFSPVRGEYLDLVTHMPMPPNTRVAFDIGIGSGILSILLAKKGVAHIVGTDVDPRAIDCAQENIQTFGMQEKIQVQMTDLFPQGCADLVICNPPWIPAKPSAPIEHAIFDQDSKMLQGFISQLPHHLNEQGQGWLIISDIAEHLGLRSREDLLQMFTNAKLEVVSKKDIKATHPKVRDQADPIHFARAKEATSLWVLKKSTE